ncbi:glycosyltransferase [Corynebacterium suedekumii]|nr:glycosyltransferase [Corynebacterium suedekumii]
MKRLDTLIRSLEYLPEDYVVLIVGDGAARPELEALAKTLGLEDRVIFAGRQPSAGIWLWYAALDVFALPRRDTKVTRTVTPIKPLSAMALDVPVAASDLPALREVTGERATYVPAGDAQALASAIEKTKDARQNGPEWTRQRTWRANGERYQAMYERLGTS